MTKRIKRLFTLVMTVALAISFCLFASAKSTNKYGLGLSAEVNNTTVNFTLKNSNDFSVGSVSVSPTVPVELKLESGDVYAVDELEKGEKIEGSFTFSANQASVSASASEEAEESSTGKTVAIIAAVALAAAAAVFIAVKGIKHKKAAAMLMAVMLLLPMGSVFSVHAVGVENSESFTLEETVTVGGKEYPVALTVFYKANSAKQSYFKFETSPENVPEKDETVTRFVTDFSGTAAAKGSVQKVSYAIKSELDGYKDAVTGDAQLSGCDWSAEKLPLKPGKNEITFTAVLESGEEQTQTYTLIYDSGEVYNHSADEVREANGTKYIENMLNIFFEVGTTDERIDEILAAEKAVRIGEINGAIMVQARVIAKNLAELETKKEGFYKYSEVVLAEINSVVDIEADAEPVYPNDSWYNNTNYSYSWDENMPSGNNWSAEAIRAPSAWAYNKYFSNVKVGVVDGGFYTGHEDYDNLITFPSSLYEGDNNAANSHGTHVAGIIGATANNGKGITGLLWNVDIIGAGYQTGSGDSIANIVDAVTAVVESGARAVNISIGFERKPSDGSNPYLTPFSEIDLAQTAGPCAAGMDALLEQGKEFVVVQSAGNGTIDTRLGDNVHRSDDAVQNGLYCAVKTTRTYGTLSAADVQNVYDRIIVAGAIQNMSNTTNGVYMSMWERSNGGERVDIYAPGVRVYSCIPDMKNPDNTNDTTIYKYAFMSGTSQAAPIVTSVAGLCFAINPNLTGAQVKAIICDDANSERTAYDYSLIDADTGLDYHPFTGDGKVISMKLCAEAALRTVCGRASYRYLNTVVAEAQKLNPDDFTNYADVQAVIDSIDYNLYEFEQDKVSAKANELIAAMDKLQERPKADYTAVDSAVAKAKALVPAQYVDFSGVTAALNAVVYGKYEDEQAEVDKMAKGILDAIAALELKQLISSTHHNVIVDNTKMLIVITTENLEDVLNCLEGGGYTVSISPNKNGIYSTGSTVELIAPKTRSAGATYKIAALGDINGDGKADGEDAFLTNLYLNSNSQAEEYMKAAYDADCSGTIDAEDVALLKRVGLCTDVIINTYTES